MIIAPPPSIGSEWAVGEGADGRYYTTNNDNIDGGAENNDFEASEPLGEWAVDWNAVVYDIIGEIGNNDGGGVLFCSNPEVWKSIWGFKCGF